MKENVILTDFEISNDWKFKKGLEEATNEEWIINSCISNQLHSSKIKKIVRYIKYFIFPWKIFCHRKQYGKIIAWQQFYGLILAFFERLFHVKKENNLYIMTFIYKEKKLVGGIF